MIESSAPLPLIHWTRDGQEHSALWRSEAALPPPKRVVMADDRMPADQDVIYYAAGPKLDVLRRSPHLEAFKEKLKLLANEYYSAGRKVVSYWTMGFNQHTRGTWVNEQAYMAHLLTGKHARPGNGAFSLTGQPSACGTAREVGTFAHRLPADMVVTNPEHRKHAEEIWQLPEGTIPDKIGFFSSGILIRSDLPDVPSSIRFSGFGMKKIMQVVSGARKAYLAASRKPEVR